MNNDNTKRPLNELSILFPLLTLYTIGYLGLVAADFFMRAALKMPAGMMPVYIALVGAYAADKEVRRWLGRTEPARRGAFFVYAWMLFFLVAFVIHTFRPDFVPPRELAPVVLQVLGIFFGSRASKHVYKTRTARGMENEKLQDRQAQVLEMIKWREKAARKDVMLLLNVSRSTANRILTKLESQGLIYRTGDNKNTYYEPTVLATGPEVEREHTSGQAQEPPHDRPTTDP